MIDDPQLRACIHCGLCLNSCPTYRVTGDEVESPRGRLVVMESWLGPGPGLDRGPIDRCLGCRNCETVCPSGVPYGELLEQTRQRMGPATVGAARWVRPLVDHVVGHPARLARLARVPGVRRLRRLVPARWRGPWDALPDRPAAALPRARRTGAATALLTGCAQAVYSPGVARSVARLAERAGQSMDVPAPDLCCGALSHHLASTDAAASALRRCVDAFADYPTVVVPSAGCSAHLRAAGELLAHDPAYAAAAARLAAKAVDAVPWLRDLDVSLALEADDRRVLYHPPCHHTHAQGIGDDALRLLAGVPGLRVVSARDPERCCGSAGSYNLLEPELARRVREEKIDRIQEAAPDLILSANPGCEIFLEKGLRERGVFTPIRHVLEYLAERLPKVP